MPRTRTGTFWPETLRGLTCGPLSHRIGQDRELILARNMGTCLLEGWYSVPESGSPM